MLPGLVKMRVGACDLASVWEVAMSLHHVPLRVAAGLIILDSGLKKRGADEETARALHRMAARAYPFLAEEDPMEFVKWLRTAELTLATALLVPFVPTSVAALGLTAFSGGLVGMYLRSPELHLEGSVRPNSQGLAQAKDVWLLGIGLGLVLERLTPRRWR